MHILILALIIFAPSCLFAQTAIIASPNLPPSATSLPQLLPVPGSPYPVVEVEVDHPILLLSDANPCPKCRLTVIPFHFPLGAILSVDWKQVQDVLSPIAAPINKSPINLAPGLQGSVDATFSKPGVYEIRVTVRDIVHKSAVSANSWINVWDSHSHIVVDGKPDPLCPAPGINPPRVRNLTPDPGPFHHPRLYATDWDWKEISERCNNGKVASYATIQLRKDLADSLDSPTSPFHALGDELEAYANANYLGTVPDLTQGVPQDVGNKSWDTAQKNLRDFYNHLKVACFLAWLSHDPSMPESEMDPAQIQQLRRLGKILAAANHIQFTNSFDVNTGAFHKDYPLYIANLDELGGNFSQYSDVALAYDFIASWMTPQEQRETRTFLFAQSVGRTTGARTVNFASGIHQRVCRGFEQNGDFMNIEEEKVLDSLVIDGEEGAVPENIKNYFLKIPKPGDYEKSDDYYPYDWVQYSFVNGPRKQPGARPYSDACAWPFARKVQIDSLQRAIWWNDDSYVTPWGFELNHEAYYGFSAWGLWPVAVAYARHGAENQYVTSNYYQTVNHLLWCSYALEGYKPQEDGFSPNFRLYDHHDGGNDYRQNHVLLMKYMYPDDPAVDLYYSRDARQVGDANALHPGICFNPFLDAIFGLDPGVNGLPTHIEDMAAVKGLPLTKVDPQEGVVVARTNWTNKAMELYFDEGWLHTGHMHAEKGNFSFFALGRPWSFAPGYHVVESGYQSEVMIQDPRFASDPKEHGYLGEGPNIRIENNADFDKAYPNCFPTPPGRLFPVTESPDKLFLIMAGDNTTAYNYCYGPDPMDSGLKRKDFAYPGIVADLLKRSPSDFSESIKLTPNYNPVSFAYRTILFVRGKHPYALIMDDIDRDDKPQNYRWQMNCTVMFGDSDGEMVDEKGAGVHSDLAIQPGSTPSESILFHSPIDDSPQENSDSRGLPRLLVRDVSEVAAPAGTPSMELNVQPLGADNPTGLRRAFLYKNQVVNPMFKVLLYPYETGDELPQTRWNQDHSQLYIALPDHHVDVITFDRSNPDHRPRVSAIRK